MYAIARTGMAETGERPYKPPFQRQLFMSDFHDWNVLGLSDDERCHACNPQK
jgi:hypothetical protein